MSNRVGQLSSGSGGAPATSPPAPAPAGRRPGVLAELRASSAPLTITELAARLGVHPNTVRFHLDTLVQTGQVERVPGAPAGPGRPPLAFRAGRGMDPAGPRNYQLLAEMLVDQLAAEPDPSGHAIATGRAWGQQLGHLGPARRGRRAPDGVERVVGLLADLGFEPERRTSDGGHGQIALRNCPFLDLVESRAHVVCPIHLGLMQGAMAAAGSPVTVQRLEPFVEPALCLAHLGPAPVKP
jgi:predicted ArsR family transcriptional regulator